ncbi:MAG: pentapeptide repeat-containing protein [Actinomycetia bacterium]|nr:pentapeptide repeat-containing protein [Actinomycetes bacterium]
MDQVKIRQTGVDLPRFDEETDLEPVSSLGTGNRLISDFQFGDAMLQALDLAEVQLLRGKVRGLRAERATITASRMDSVEFTSCDLSSLRWTGGKVSRVRFDACRLLGARFDGMTVEHVVFTGCKLDYATLDQVRATGPVLFAGSSLREAALMGCSLAGSLFDDCDLRLADFGVGNYRGCDLRGNDLSALTGASHLKHVIIGQAQTMQLGVALATELEITLSDDLDG